jgi:hypothetical protein
MDFNDYTNQLSQSLNQENKSELETLYSINSDLLKYFKAIDKHAQALLSASNIDLRSIEEIKGVLPVLNKLKFEINLLDANSLSITHKAKINKTISYIKEVMLIAEVNSIANQFFDLLEKNETAFTEEQKQQAKEAEIKSKEQEEIEQHKKAILKKAFRSCPWELLEDIDVALNSSGYSMSGEVSEKIETYLKTKILAGQYITYEECNYLLDSRNYLEIEKTICKNYIQPKLYPAVNCLENWESDDVQEYRDLMLRIVMSCIDNDNKCAVLPFEFLKDIIISSENIDAMIILYHFDEQDFYNGVSTINKQSLEEIKNLANKRYLELTNKNNEEQNGQQNEVEVEAVQQQAYGRNTQQQIQTSSNSGCFVATACFGDYDAPDLFRHQ